MLLGSRLFGGEIPGMSYYKCTYFQNHCMYTFTTLYVHLFAHEIGARRGVPRQGSICTYTRTFH